MAFDAMTMRRMDQEGTQRSAGAMTLQASPPAQGGHDGGSDQLMIVAAGDDPADDASGGLPFTSPQRQGSTLTKAELADLLFEQVGLNKREA